MISLAPYISPVRYNHQPMQELSALAGKLSTYGSNIFYHLQYSRKLFAQSLSFFSAQLPDRAKYVQYNKKANV
jgi:hypothetical protein